MKLDSLVRLIASSDFMAFREMAIRFLVLRGYVDPSLTDGWSDGGTDVRIFHKPPNPAKIAIQITVERDWSKKLRDDSQKIKDRLDIDTLIFISSRRIPETDFHEESQQIWLDYNVHVSKMDSQAIASTFFNAGETAFVLNSLGIDTSRESSHSQYSPKDDLAASFLFFSEETLDLRKEIVRSAIFSSLLQEPNGISRDQLRSKTLAILNLTIAEGHRVDSSIDRLLQSGQIIQTETLIKLKDNLREAGLSNLVIRDQEVDGLKAKLTELILKPNPRRRLEDDFLEKILEHSGALIAAVSSNINSELSHQWGTANAIGRSINKRLRAIHALLDSINFPTGEMRNGFLYDLTTIVSSTLIGKQFLVSELLTVLNQLDSQDLVRAFGAKQGVEILLDASVAIPILSGLLYKANADRFGFPTMKLYETFQDSNINLILPLDYAQEAATHLVWAYRDYRNIISEGELIGSDNAYVAHYVALTKEFASLHFLDYVSGLGFPKGFADRNLYDDATFYSCRDAIMPKIQRHFELYNISVRPLGTPSRTAMQEAETAVSYAMHDLQIHRPSVVLKHDTRTIAYLTDTERKPEYATLLCTWDSLHFKVRSELDTYWGAMTPSSIIDLFSFCVGGTIQSPLQTPLFWVKSFSDELITKAANVWDTLVSHERENIHDGDILRKAREFKEHYMTLSLEGPSRSKIIQEWNKWKSKEG